MIYLICIIFGIFVGQEYSIYLPNIKLLTLHLLTYVKDKTSETSSKEIEKKNIMNKKDTVTTSIIDYIYKFFT